MSPPTLVLSLKKYLKFAVLPWKKWLPKLQTLLAGYLIYRKKISLQETAGFFKKLSYMLAAGISLQNALLVLNKSASRELSLKISLVRDKLLKGRGASAAFAVFPCVKGEVEPLIKVGEETANLAGVLQEISQYFEDKINLRNKIVRSLAYPVFVLVSCFVALILISVFLLPNFKNIFESSSVSLPVITRFFIDFGTFLRINGKDVLLSLMALIFLMTRLLKKQPVKRFMRKSLLKIPGLSEIIKGYIHLRIVKTLTTLLGARIPLVEALKYVRYSCSHPVFNGAFARIITKVESGDSFARAAQKERILSSFFLEAIVVSEETGDLLSLLKGLALIFDQELEGNLKKLTVFLEPVATLAVGVFVGLVAISMLYPMTTLINSIR